MGQDEQRQPQQQKMNWTTVASFSAALSGLGQVIIAVVTAVALIYAAGSLDATRDQNTVSEQGQFTDRYSRAIEQLGQQGVDRLQIRLGGIYALERLAYDSPRDQTTIIEVLATFVRTSTNQTPHRVHTKPYEATCPAGTPVSPEPDVQAALTVLGRQGSIHDNAATIDLSRTCLRGADLSEANLTGANLTTANLDGADLSGARLSGADFTAANLDGADLSNASMTEAKFFKANLRASFLGGADLTYANLFSANLDSANLSVANLEDVHFPTEDSYQTFLADANFRGAYLLNADLTAANLHAADLRDVDLTNASLEGANLEEAQHDELTVVDDARTDSTTRGQWW